MTRLSRRDAIQRISMIMGGVISAPALSILNGCQPQLRETVEEDSLFTARHEEIVATIAGLAIPATSTPGAIEAGVPEFIKIVMTDCYPLEDQERFLSGLDDLNQAAKDQYNKEFLALDEPQQLEFLTKTEASAKEERQANPTLKPSALIMLKELTLIGYFTSEIGATQALAYDYVPGAYHGCVPLKEGQKAWAT